MIWKIIDEIHRRRFNSSFIYCEDMFEISFVIESIMEYHPKLTRACVANAVYKTINEIPHPRQRNQFWESLSCKLEVI